MLESSMFLSITHMRSANSVLQLLAHKALLSDVVFDWPDDVYPIVAFGYCRSG